MKFETFVKEEYRAPAWELQGLYKRWGHEPRIVKKIYGVRVYHKGNLIDEMEFSSAIDAQNYIQKTEMFYSNLV